MTTSTENRYRLHPQAASRKVAGEVFVVTDDRAFHRLHVATSVALFDALAGTANGVSPRELTELLLREFDVTPDQAAQDVADFLAALLARHLAVPAELAAASAAPLAEVSP